LGRAREKRVNNFICGLNLSASLSPTTMASNTQQFRIRNASSISQDSQFINAAWDSTLPYLASIGAGEMWGSQPFSEREGHRQEIIDVIQKSEEKSKDDSRRWLIAELEDGSAIGAAMIRDALPYYLLEREELKDKTEKSNSLLFIEVLIADHRSQPRYKGSGAALVEAIKHRALQTGKDAVYLDVWAGNERKLNRQVMGTAQDLQEC
jgi:hypothetical protein